MNYELWDRESSINGVEASHFLNNPPFKDYNGDIILIYGENGKVANVECKDILASVYDIDSTLPLNDFMDAYFEAITPKEEPEESE